MVSPLSSEFLAAQFLFFFHINFFLVCILLILLGFPLSKRQDYL